MVVIVYHSARMKIQLTALVLASLAAAQRNVFYTPGCKNNGVVALTFDDGKNLPFNLLQGLLMYLLFHC
jgi:peptidoglycan/xylan/chitin deacetylase (PgdA/CDA1 family)